MLHGVRGGCYIVVTVFEKEVIGADHKYSAKRYFQGLRPACMEIIQGKGARLVDTSRMFEFPIKEFFKQPRSLLGAGAYENAGPEAAAMGLSHVLFVTSGLEGTGIIDECRTNFENAGVWVTVYNKVESNPKDYNVMDAYRREPSRGDVRDAPQHPQAHALRAHGHRKERLRASVEASSGQGVSCREPRRSARAVADWAGGARGGARHIADHPCQEPGRHRDVRQALRPVF